MARGATRRLSAWDQAVAETLAAGTRYRLRKVAASPFIYVLDLQAPPGGKREFSLRPLRRDEDADVRAALERILAAGDRPWVHERAPHGKSWEVLAADCLLDWERRLKRSTSAAYRSALKDLQRLNVPRSEEGMRSWLLAKTPGSRPFLTRLETLGQIRRSLSSAEGAPGWLPLAMLEEMRRLHAARKPRRGNDLQGIRGIPTIAESQAYLSALSEEFALERWCLAMLHCYGLRNHELWWCSPLTVAEGDIQPGWTLVPGWWRTKSRHEHWVWPLVPEWIERFGLGEKLEWAQSELHRRMRPKLVSSRDQTMPWVEGDPGDPGVCVNNHQLGAWITRRMRTALPEWRARVPDTDGRYRAADRPVQIAPYDLRHAWAVTVATDPRWSHVRDEDAARAMGHDLEIHRRRYQRWIGAEERRRRAMAAVRAPETRPHPG
ncbi:MAG: hypothetical protein VKI63_06045 [Cyanobium sp.]|nr:hypothetical protein [Cyanobium sp.]